MTFTSRAKRPVVGVWPDAFRWIDALVEFVRFEKRLIIRGIALEAKGNFVKAFANVIKTYAVIMGHCFLYNVIGRGTPGGISYLEYNAACFTAWGIFARMTHKGSPTFIHLSANVPLRIRWINLCIADIFWISLKVLMGTLGCYLTFLLYPVPAITGTFTMPNVPLIAGLLVLSGLLGSGVGLLLHAAKTAVPVVEAVMEVVMWFGFMSSGVYISYSQLPPALAPYFSLNPMMSVIEYSRLALHPGYPVLDLTLTYPVAVAGVLIPLGLVLNRKVRGMVVP